MHVENAELRMDARTWMLLLALSVLWGGSFFFVGIAVREVPPLGVVFARVALAAAALHLLLAMQGRTLRLDRARWQAVFAMALLNNVVPFVLFAWGQAQIASGVAAILNATTPLFGAVLAHFATRDEKLTRAKAFGIAAGFAGVAAMMGPAVGDAAAAPLWAQLACLGAAFSYALSGIYGRRFKALGLAPLEIATGQVTASSLLLMLPMLPMLLVDRPWEGAMPSAQALLALAGLALLSTALAYILFFRILAAAGATNLLLVTFLIPVTAIVLGAAFLGETLALRHFAGMALIGVGLAAIDGRLFAKRSKGR
jgi:drug/metabolite transporter (DMT)-like permease